MTFAYRGNDELAAYRDLHPGVIRHMQIRDVKLTVRENKQWRLFSRDTTPAVRVESVREIPKTEENKIVVLLPLAQLPAKELRMQFAAEARPSYIVPNKIAKPQDKRLNFFPARKSGFTGINVVMVAPYISIVVRKEDEAAPTPQVSRVRSISFVSANAANLGALYAVHNPNNAIDTRVLVKVQNQETDLKRLQNQEWKTLNAHLIDENGKIYREWKYRFGSSYSLPFRFDGRRWKLPQKGEPNEVFSTYSSDFSLASIPASAGEITFKAQLTVDGEWPLPISIVVRKRDDWTLKKSRTLKLKSIDVEPESVEDLKYKIRVLMTYSGKQKLFSTNQYNELFYDDYSPLFATRGIDYVHELKSDNSLHQPKLISQWSQRVEIPQQIVTTSVTPGRKSRILNLGYGNPAQAISASCDDGCEIIYSVDLTKLKTRPPFLLFKADIGVEGDGFLPVSIELPISKKP